MPSIIENHSYYPMDATIKTLHKCWHDGSLIFMPREQPLAFPSLEWASRMVDSYINRFPVPQVYFYAQNRDVWVVLDGTKRLRSIFHFIDGDMPNGHEFRLEGTNVDRPGLMFDTMHSDDQEQLMSHTQRVIIIHPFTGLGVVAQRTAMQDMAQRLHMLE